MKAILNLVLAALLPILVAVPATLAFVKWREASDLTSRLEASSRKVEELEGEAKDLKERNDELDGQLREASKRLAEAAQGKAGVQGAVCPEPAPLVPVAAGDTPRHEPQARYRPGALRLTTRSNGLVLTVAPGSSLRLGPDSLELVSVHFVRTEPTAGQGGVAPLTVRLVHRKEGSDQLVVLSVPVRESAFQHRTIWHIWNHIPALGVPEVTVPDVSIDPSSFLPEGRAFELLEGPLTLPPCAARARFYQFKDAIGIGKDQIERFLARTKSSAR
jgi:carbonic anhydrase